MAYRPPANTAPIPFGKPLPPIPSGKPLPPPPKQQLTPQPSIPTRESWAERRRTCRRLISVEDAVNTAGSETLRHSMMRRLSRKSGMNLPLNVPSLQQATLSNVNNKVPVAVVSAPAEAPEIVISAVEEDYVHQKAMALDPFSANYHDSVMSSISDLPIDNDEQWWNEVEGCMGQYFEYYNENDEKVEIDGTKVVAVWPFPGEQETDLKFLEGDIITVIRRYSNGWWEGELNGVVGDFPSNYVELCTDEDEEEDEDAEDDEPNKQALRAATFSGANSNKAATQEKPRMGTVGNSSSNPSPSPSSSSSSSSSPSYGSEDRSNTQAPGVVLRPLPIRQGFMQKKGHVRRNWKVRYFVLEATGLTYYANPGDMKPKGWIPLHKSTLVKLCPEMKRSNCFTISVAVKPYIYYVACPTGEEMVGWMDAIMAAKSNLPS